MLLEKLKLNAGEPVFEKAIAYYQSAAIKSYNYTQQGNKRYQIKAIVKASGAFGINLNLDFNNGRFKIDHYCTCSPGNAALCEHAAAVVYKFLADDLPRQSPGLIKPVQPEGIELLKLAAAGPDAKATLFYKIEGLDGAAENFTFTFSAPEGDDAWVSSLVDCLGNLNYSIRKREQLLDSLNCFDCLVVSYLEKAFSGKDPQRHSVVLPKTKENLKLLLVLIENGRAIGHHGSALELGETLKPLVYVTGDETCLEFTYDLTEFELNGIFDRDLSFVINHNTLQPVATACLEKIPPKLVISPEQLGEVLFEILPQLSDKVRLETAPGFRSHRLSLREPEVSLTLDYEQGRIICRPEIKLLDEVYHGQDCLRLLTGEPKFDRSATDPKQWYSVNRQPFTELLHFLRRHQFEFTAAGWVIESLEQQLQFMLDGPAQMAEKWPCFTGPGLADFKVTPVKLEPLVQLDLDEKIDWFDFRIHYNLGGQTYTHQQIMGMLRRFGSGNYLQIGGQWFFVDESAKFDLLNQALPKQSSPADTGREKLYNLAFLRQLFSEHGITVQGNSIYNQFETDITGAGLIEPVPLPENFRGELRAYQKKGVDWLHFLHKYHFGGILADDMGLGKTIQALTLIKTLTKPEPVLIICPRSLIYNWTAEIDKFYPETNYLVYHGSPENRELLRPSFSEAEIIITTYDIIVNDIETLQNYHFYYCILDEAQHIKNRQTQRAKDCRRIQARRRLIMTGTPVENRLEDLWSLFDFLMPGYLGTQTEFKDNYIAPLKTAKQSEILALLRKKTAPFMLRRLKEDVLAELPPKISFTRNVAMTQLQEDVYRTILKQVKQEILNSVSNLGLNKSRITVLSALTKLRQVCDHPGLALPEIGAEADSGKIDALMELIDEGIGGGHKLVVFSQFVRMLKLIRSKLRDAGINHLYLDGSTSDRMERINYFNTNPSIPVFLISLKAGGVGINLTAADIVIHADPWWNPMVENQATDRVHRMGQQKPVMVYKLVTIGTVEEKLIRLQERKKALFDAILQKNGDPAAGLTWEEIKELFEINE